MFGDSLQVGAALAGRRGDRPANAGIFQVQVGPPHDGDEPGGDGVGPREVGVLLLPGPVARDRQFTLEHLLHPHHDQHVGIGGNGLQQRVEIVGGPARDGQAGDQPGQAAGQQHSGLQAKHEVLSTEGPPGE